MKPFTKSLELKAKYNGPNLHQGGENNREPLAFTTKQSKCTPQAITPISICGVAPSFPVYRHGTFSYSYHQIAYSDYK
jgi:hypothetical protein